MKTLENEQEICAAALRLWGAQAQTMMVFEEMAELQNELCKCFRDRSNKEAIAEEIADVEIMLEQMKILHKCADEVDEYKLYKLNRLQGRIREEDED